MNTNTNTETTHVEAHMLMRGVVIANHGAASGKVASTRRDGPGGDVMVTFTQGRTYAFLPLEMVEVEV